MKLLMTKSVILQLVQKAKGFNNNPLKYTLEIISEAEKVEELIQENGASTEITDNIIFQAVRRNKTEKKKSIKTILVRIVSRATIVHLGFNVYT